MPDEERLVVPEGAFSPETGRSPEIVERSPDFSVENPEEESERAEKVEPIPEVPETQHVSRNAAELKRNKDPLFAAVEGILENKLKPLFLAMPEKKQKQFLVVADKVTEQIREAISKGKLDSRRTMKWIESWLRLIPNVDKYWIEQVKKTRKDELIELQEKEQQKVRNAA